MSLTLEIENLDSWQLQLPKLWLSILGEMGSPTYVLDWVLMAAVKRTLSLSAGLHSLVVAKNMVCARALLRMQLDTVSRLMAYTYVENPHQVASEILKGKQLNQFKSKDGEKLRDGYLVDRLTADYPWVRSVYDATSGYVHFSEQQIFDSIASLGGDEERTINFVLTHEDDKFAEASWEEVVACFNHLTAILSDLVEQYGHVKQANHSFQRTAASSVHQD